VVPEIDVDDLATRLASGAPLVDVRRPDEYEAGHVPGALLVPLDDLVERRDDLPGERPLLVICRTGVRSAAAAEWLIAQGIEAVNVAGGTLAWMSTGRPVVSGFQQS
jgi:rhodanese-related sulfurtransferase